MSIDEACAYHQYALTAANRRPLVRQGYERTIRRFITFLSATGRVNGHGPASLNDLSVDNARAFLIWLQTEHLTVNPLTKLSRPKGPRTIRDAANTLKIFSRFLMTENVTDTDHLMRLKLPKAETTVIETFSADQCRALVVAAEQSTPAARNVAIVYFLLATGVRADELCKLRIGELDLKERRARIHGKGAIQRWVYPDAATIRVLTRYLATRHHKRDDDPLFMTDDELAPLRTRSLWRTIHLLGHHAGIRGVRCSPHTFRHTFALTWLRAHPGALFHLQQLLGHSALEMTKRYARLAETETPLDGPSPVDVLLGARR